MPDRQHVTPTAFGEMRLGHCAVDEVMTLQSFLASLGYLTSTGAPLGNGHFDEEMQRVVARMQQEKLGLSPSGELDPLTRLGISELMQTEAHRGRPAGFYSAVGMLFECGEDGVAAALRTAQIESIAELHTRTHPPDKEEVRRIQNILAARGFNLGETGLDGMYGPLTTAALRVYQMELGLHPLGMINGQCDKVTNSFLQIDDDELNRGSTEWNSPQMQYASKPEEAAAPSTEQSRVDLLRKLLGEITSNNEAEDEVVHFSKR